MSLSERLGIRHCLACGGRLREDWTHVEKPGTRFSDIRATAGLRLEPDWPDGGAAYTDVALWQGSPYQAAE